MSYNLVIPDYTDTSENHRERHVIQMKVSENGRIVIPADIRQKMGLKEGDVVYWEYTGDEARLSTFSARLRKAQAIVRRHVPEGVSLVDELLTERRQEATDD